MLLVFVLQVLRPLRQVRRIQVWEVKAEKAEAAAGNDGSLHLLRPELRGRDGVLCSDPQQEVLDITRQLLAELGQDNDCEIEEKKSKLEQLKTVLEM